MAEPRPILAYEAKEDFEGHGGIVFARHAIVARRRAADEYNDGEFHGITCKRAPWADQYAPGPVPALVMVEAGWWFECNGCTRRIDSDAEDTEDEDREPIEPVEVGNQLWCSPACRKSDLATRSARKIAELAAIQRLRDLLWSKRPGVTFLGGDRAAAFSSDDGVEVRECSVWFTFPGATNSNGAEYKFTKADDEPRIWMHPDDVQAWEAFRDRQNAEASP